MPPPSTAWVLVLAFPTSVDVGYKYFTVFDGLWKLTEVKTMKKINRLGSWRTSTHPLTQVVLTLAAFAASVAAQSGGTFVIQKSVIAGGGGQTTGGQFIVDATIGQHIAGTTSAGGTFELGSGFWGGGATPSANVTV